MTQEEEIYNKALQTIKDAIEGKGVNPQTFSVSLEVLRAVFLNIYNVRAATPNNNWADTIED